LIPRKLTLDGFLSYRQQVDVDLTGIKVACISGANGAGKSSLFDAVTWVLFGKARRSDDALIHNSAETCRISFEFEYESAIYRVERSKRRGKGTQLEFQIQKRDGAWKPLTEAGIRATEDRIRETLRLDYDTFVNASFFLQGKADMFAVQTPGKRKEILSAILGLDIWESYREEAARRRREVQREIDSKRSFLEDVLAELGQESAIISDLAYKRDLLAQTTKARESRQALVEKAREQKRAQEAEKKRLAALAEQTEILQTRLEEVTQTITIRKADLDKYESLVTGEKDIEKRYSKWQEVKKILSGLDERALTHTTLALRRGEIAAEIRAIEAQLRQELQGLEQQNAEIENIRAQQSDLKTRLKEMEGELKELKTALETLETVKNRHTQAKEERAKLAGMNDQLRGKMKELQERIEQLDNATGAECPLCGQSLSEEHRIETLARIKGEGKEFGDLFRKNTDRIKEIDQELVSFEKEIEAGRNLQAEITKAEREASGLAEKISSNDARIAGWDKTGKPRMEKISQQIKEGSTARDEKQRLADIDKEIDRLEYDPDLHEQMRKEESNLRPVEEDFRELGKARVAVETITREITSHEKQAGELKKDLARTEAEYTQVVERTGDSAAVLSELASLENDFQEAQKQENDIRLQVGGAQQKLKALETRKAQKAEIEGEIDAFNRRIVQLKLLEGAFGKDGIPALLIEQSIPEIETQANNILERLSYDEMSVNFETERAYADNRREDKRQTLDIIVRDSAGTRPYELYSGGEAFRVNFAIRLALSRMLAKRSGARLQTLVIDEGFGSQDSEGRQRLVEAINLVSSDFEKILVITHLEELKDAFPSRIEVTKTPEGSRVEVNP